MPKSGTAPKTRDQVKELRGRGLTTREIAIRLGKTTQAIYWHLARLDGKKEQAS